MGAANTARIPHPNGGKAFFDICFRRLPGCSLRQDSRSVLWQPAWGFPDPPSPGFHSFLLPHQNIPQNMRRPRQNLPSAACGVHAAGSFMYCSLLLIFSLLILLSSFYNNFYFPCKPCPLPAKLLLMLTAPIRDPIISPVPSLVGLVVRLHPPALCQPLQHRIQGGILGIGNRFQHLADLIAIGIAPADNRQNQKVQHGCIQCKIISPLLSYLHSVSYVSFLYIIFNIIYFVKIYIWFYIYSGYKKNGGTPLFKEFLHFALFLVFHFDDFFFVVASACLANSVGHHKCAAFAAFYQIRALIFQFALLLSRLALEVLFLDRWTYVTPP